MTAVVESSPDNGVTWVTVPDPPEWVARELFLYGQIMDACNGIRWRLIPVEVAA